MIRSALPSIVRRDLRGYAGSPPNPRWPGNARIAVSFVINFEEGAELAVEDGDERNETVHEMHEQSTKTPDLCTRSHYDYGTRAAWWRIADLLDAHGVPATVSACGRAVARSPWIARNAVDRGMEVAAHGWRWESHANMSPDMERENIRRAIDAIREATGVTPAGWHTRSSPSLNTRRLLMESGNFLYDSDSYSDDLPYYVGVDDQPHLVIPYAFDTNDMHFHQGHQRFSLGDDFFTYIRDAFEWLYREGEHAPKLMSVGLHLRMIGRPGRMEGLNRLISHIRSRPGVWFARRVDIARHWLETHPAQSRQQAVVREGAGT